MVREQQHKGGGFVSSGGLERTLVGGIPEMDGSWMCSQRETGMWVFVCQTQSRAEHLIMNIVEAALEEGVVLTSSPWLWEEVTLKAR